MDEKTALRTRDFWASLALILVSVFFIYRTSLLPFFEANAAGVESGKWYNSSAIVPYGIFIAILVLSIALLFQAIRDGGATMALKSVSGLHRQINFDLTKMFMIAVLLATFIFALVPRVDFILAGGLLITALIYGFHDSRPIRVAAASLHVLVPGAYALIAHLPQEDWGKYLDDDWLTLAALVSLTVWMCVETRLNQGRMPGYVRATPFVAILVPVLLVCTMAFGFRQNVPNRTGLLFQHIEYHYYVTVRPFLSGAR